MDYLFDPDKIYKAYDNSLIEQGRAEGRQEGCKKALNDLVTSGIISKEVAEQQLKKYAKQTLSEETGVSQK